ncbi:unnamed protein product [Auanema sp. JU1783]|nr:unnamed protein product [Auanema sp. JU1783]
MISLASLIVLSTVAVVQSTPSVWACPFVPVGPMVQPFDMRMGEDCPSDSFVHYYSCCDDNPFQCCFHFETWAIVIFSIIVLSGVAAGLFFAGRLLLRQN